MLLSGSGRPDQHQAERRTDADVLQTELYITSIGPRNGPNLIGPGRFPGPIFLGMVWFLRLISRLACIWFVGGKVCAFLRRFSHQKSHFRM